MQAARASISILKICAGEFPESTDFFTLKNNTALRNFKIIIKKIEKFFKTQNHNFSRNFRDLNSIKNEFYGLIDEFDNHMRLLNFSMPININQQSAKDKESAKNFDLVNKDTDEMKEQELIRKEITMNANLSPDNFIIEEAPIRGKVRKWHYKPFAKDVALKELLESQKNKPNNLDLQIDITIRARLALEIARGLNYLEEYEIFHHDVRSANVLVDCFEHAKTTNFELSRNFSVAISKSIDISMENVRYMAPEKINNTTIRYNSKCEFRNALWELAEQKLPFSESGLTVFAISQLILDGAMNLKFSSYDVPKKWKQLVLKAIEQTKLKNGSKKRAWETIAKYSEIGNDFTAKYWKGHYLYHKVINFPYSDNERMQLAAEAFKEAADGANLQDAQYMYASCIYKKDPYKAIEYFEKAADQNHTVAMHNLGLLYYLGKHIDVDKKKGEYWFKRAVDGNLDASIEFCKKTGITF
ncbi:kinase-like protein [Gigaspora margarita]|uniref:Kinase-like protein n=1 Tax=Gigaspora margarita TaxID=4874 RepID=A0A8H4AN84_GIGMA|nr:kinase-like protein [Gigaspora margarita]